MDRTKWLDGLRGIAATIVCFDHFFMGEIWHPFKSFWAEPPEENRLFIQLPPVRILFSAHAMVTLFMVISGYAISVNLIKIREQPQQQRGQSFLNRLSSAVIRRLFRIYLPVFVISIISQLLFFFNLYNWTFEEGVLRGIQPWTSPWAHVKWLFIYMMDSINIIAFEYNGGFNGQLWTMPVEYRGSCVVYLFMVGLAGWKRELRLWLLPVLAIYFLWYGIWDIFGFLWGLWLAEKAALTMDATANGNDDDSDILNSSAEKLRLPLYRFPGEHYYRQLLAVPRRTLMLSNMATISAFVMGVHLLCLGDDGHLTPGYQWLGVFNSHKWKDNWQVYHWCWKSVGAALLVFAVSRSRVLQRPLNTRPIQYLGKISFSLYLVHQAMYHLWRDPLRNYVWFVLNGNLYPGTVDGLNEPILFYLTWWISGFIMAPVLIFAAHYYTIHVDNRCVAFTKRLERWMTS
jgi:peptidoglycan/LPS O-acetylase OafA/YrhL